MIAGRLALQEYALLPSPLRRRDARAKLVLLLGYTMAVVTTPFPARLCFGGYLALLLIALFASPLEWGTLFRSLFVLVPLLAGVALFAPFHTRGFTEGVTLLLSVATKSFLATSATIILTATTPFARITSAAEDLRMPRLLVLIFNFTYRYLFVLIEEAQRMQRARDSRGYRPRYLWQAVTIGHMISALFLRSYERAERIHRAMLSRGHSHEQASPSVRQPWAGTDIALLFLLLSVIVLLRVSAHFSPSP